MNVFQQKLEQWLTNVPPNIPEHERAQYLFLQGMLVTLTCVSSGSVLFGIVTSDPVFIVFSGLLALSQYALLHFLKQGHYKTVQFSALIALGIGMIAYGLLDNGIYGEMPIGFAIIIMYASFVTTRNQTIFIGGFAWFSMLMVVLIRDAFGIEEDLTLALTIWFGHIFGIIVIVVMVRAFNRTFNDTLMREQDAKKELQNTLKELEQALSDYKHAESERLNSEAIRLELAKEADIHAFKMRFVTMISHEYRTPLTIIQASNELLFNYYGELTPEQRTKHHNRINASIREIVEMVDHVLLTGNAANGLRESTQKEVNLNLIVSRVVTYMQETSDDKYQIMMRIEGQARFLLIDESLFRHALDALISNAIKYTSDSGKVAVTVRWQPAFVTVSIKDNGVGMNFDDLERLQKPFERGDNAKFVAGTGLGMTIAKEAIELHNGEITWQSNDGQGTHVLIKLPIPSDAPIVTGMAFDMDTPVIERPKDVTKFD